VLAWRQGRFQRLPAGQPVVHVSAHEADAWCHWAGRRLPSDAEWSLAARQAAGRGWAWGEVHEWVAGTARAYPGGPVPPAGALRVTRGSSAQASARLRHPGARRYAPADADWSFCGFRSCTI
jgi:formylglycine-generating enzyme required for sulfatase activity